MGKPLILYTGMRGLDLERRAEVQAAHRCGYELVVAGALNAGFERYPIDRHIATNTLDFDGAESTIVAYLQDHDLAPQGLVAWTDAEVELVARLGAKLGVDVSTPAAAYGVRNKAAMRRALDQVAGANPRYALVTDESDISTAIDQVGTPALLKPAGASGSRGIFEITESPQAHRIFQAWRQYCQPSRDPVYGFFSEEAVLEEKLSGSEHSVAGLVHAGKIYILGIADKRIDSKIPIIYQSTIPSNLDIQVQLNLVRLTEAAVRAVGINQCGFHVDLIVTQDGPKILEVGGRLGGECINSHLIPLATGGEVVPYDLLLSLFRRTTPLPVPSDAWKKATRQAAFRHVVPPRPGRIIAFDGVDQLRQNPAVHDIEMAIGVGESLYLPHDRAFRYTPLYLVVTAAMDADIDRLCDHLADQIHMEVATQ